MDIEELLRLLPLEDQLNVDETGRKDNGKRPWTWCFRATMFTLFKISPSHGSEVLLEVLGEEFDGVLPNHQPELRTRRGHWYSQFLHAATNHQQKS